MGDNGVVTICTATIGHSAGHLNRQMFDLHGYCKTPFRQIVCDDGTADPNLQRLQRQVCETHGAEWMENAGPVWGISYCWNALFDQVKTPWAFCVEDGLRPGRGWLETALDAIKQIGDKTWNGHKVGMMGCSSFEDWHLALAGVLPTKRGFLDFWRRADAETYSAFWGGKDWPNWNDGLWCWKRLLPLFQHACNQPEAKTWPETVGFFKHVVQFGEAPPNYKDIGRRPLHAWPQKRTGGPAWFPGAFMLVNMDAWRDCGRFRDGCTFFEGHLGVRMAQRGYLSLALEFPPWLHYAGMGFVASGVVGKTPRDHQVNDGPNSILLRDFGCNGEHHRDIYELVNKHFPREEQDDLEKQLAQIDLYMNPAWGAWL
jgi:hypothetical protein